MRFDTAYGFGIVKLCLENYCFMLYTGNRMLSTSHDFEDFFENTISDLYDFYIPRVRKTITSAFNNTCNFMVVSIWLRIFVAIYTHINI